MQMRWGPYHYDYFERTVEIKTEEKVKAERKWPGDLSDKSCDSALKGFNHMTLQATLGTYGMRRTLWTR